MEIVKENLLLH